MQTRFLNYLKNKSNDVEVSMEMEFRTRNNYLISRYGSLENITLQLRDFYNYMNPLSIQVFSTLEILKEFNYSMLIDGFYPLGDFFLKNFNASDLNSFMLVAKQHERVVPPVWKDKVILYELFNKKAPVDVENNLLIIFTIFSPSMGDLEDVKKELQRLYKYSCKNKKEVLICTSLKVNLYDDSFEEFNAYSFEYSRLIFEIFGKDVKSIAWEELSNTSNLRGAQYSIVDINNFNCSYSFVDDFMCNKGSFNLNWKTWADKDKEELHDLSLYHGIKLSRFENNDFTFWKSFLAYERQIDRKNIKSYKKEIKKLFQRFSKDKPIFQNHERD